MAVSLWLWMKAFEPVFKAKLSDFAKAREQLGWQAYFYGGSAFLHLAIIAALEDAYIGGIEFLLFAGISFYATHTKITSSPLPH